MRRHLEPGPDHPITIEPKDTPVSVKLAGDIVLASQTHLELREAAYPPVAYLPRTDIDGTNATGVRLDWLVEL